MPEPMSNVPDFHGNFRHGIDESRRLMVPAKWRPEDASILFRLVLWPINVEQYLLVLPPERWQLMLQKLRGNNLQDEGVAALERVIGATSAVLTLDRAGRLCLPENLARRAALERDAELVGRLDKFEIWNPSRYEASTAQDKLLAANVAKQIAL